MRFKIRLDTEKDVLRFVNIATTQTQKIVVRDSTGLCVSAKSMIGMLYAMTFDELWCETENNCEFLFRDFIV